MVIVAGRPGLGSSTSPSRRRSRKRRRHFATVWESTPHRAAAATFVKPSEQANTILDRAATACEDLRRRDHRSSVSRSSSESSSTAFGRPTFAIPHYNKEANFRRRTLGLAHTQQFGSLVHLGEPGGSAHRGFHSLAHNGSQPAVVGR